MKDFYGLGVKLQKGLGFIAVVFGSVGYSIYVKSKMDRNERKVAVISVPRNEETRSFISWLDFSASHFRQCQGVESYSRGARACIKFLRREEEEMNEFFSSLKSGRRHPLLVPLLIQTIWTDDRAQIASQFRRIFASLASTLKVPAVSQSLPAGQSCQVGPQILGEDLLAALDVDGGDDHAAEGGLGLVGDGGVGHAAVRHEGADGVEAAVAGAHHAAVDLVGVDLENADGLVDLVVVEPGASETFHNFFLTFCPVAKWRKK